MKKILVVLLVLAVAGGVFAQSSNWSAAGTVEFGTRINFDPRWGSGDPVAGKDGGDQTARADGLAYNWWDVPRMKFCLSYAGAGYTVGLDMNTRHDNEFYVSFARPNFKAKGGIWGFEDIFWSNKDGQNNAPDRWPFRGADGTESDNTIKRLWGEYYVLDGMVTLTAAYKSEELEFWASDKTATFYHNTTPRMPGILEQENWQGWYYMNHGFFDNRFTFTHTDAKTYFKTNLEFSGFEFGILIPNLFGNGRNATPGQHPRGSGTANGNEFVNDVLKKSIFGAKINLFPIEFAAQFKFEDYGVYFGGKFFLGPVSIGASFMGIMNPADGSSADKRMKVGGELSYDAGAMGAGVKASLDKWNKIVDGKVSEDYSQIISLNPYFFFKIIPSHLGFKLDAGFYFTKDVRAKIETPDTYWAVQPQLFWNFNGTGAAIGYPWGSSAGASTGMFVRYRMISNTANFLDVIFSWSL
jgi:hypothetical protein